MLKPRRKEDIMYKEILEKEGSERKAAAFVGVSRTKFNTLLKKELGLCNYPGCKEKPREGRTRCELHRNPPQDMKRKKESFKKWQKDNRVYLNEQSKEYYKQNHQARRDYLNEYYKSDDQKLKMRIKRHQREELYKNDNKLTLEQVKHIFEKFEQKCFKCGSTHKLQLDHHFPRSKGGLLTIDNAVLLCRSCNSRKRDQNPAKFYTPEELAILEVMLKLK